MRHPMPEGTPAYPACRGQEQAGYDLYGLGPDHVRQLALRSTATIDIQGLQQDLQYFKIHRRQRVYPLMPHTGDSVISFQMIPVQCQP